MAQRNLINRKVPMNKKIIKTSKVSAPIGPYNQAVVINNLVFTAGQIALDPVTNDICLGGVSEQTRQVLNNLKAILEAAGSSLPQVVKTTVYLKHMGDFAAMNAVYAEFFEAKMAPARTTVEVARLPKDVLVEIEAVAAV